MLKQRSLRICLAASLTLFALAGGDAAQALGLQESELFFELNDTDGDLGIHASIDGGPYTRLVIKDPQGRTILDLRAQGILAAQELTQLMFESAEPSFDELDPERFFERFPAGRYSIEITRGTQKFEKKVWLSPVLAAPPSDVEVDGKPAAEDCEDLPLPVANPPVLIEWDEVTDSHPEVGKEGDVEIVRYQLFVERNDVKFAVDLPPDVTEFEVPPAITEAGGVFKFEIIARNTRRNNTAIESCFIVP
jgi:hypothetical protein